LGGILTRGSDDRLEGELQTLVILLEVLWLFPQGGMLIERRVADIPLAFACGSGQAAALRAKL
jgi:hypothetical protein